MAKTNTNSKQKPSRLSAKNQYTVAKLDDHKT